MYSILAAIYFVFPNIVKPYACVVNLVAVTNTWSVGVVDAPFP